MATNEGSPRRSVRPAVCPARLRGGGEAGAAAGFGLSAAGGSGSGEPTQAAASSSRAVPLPKLPSNASVEDIRRFLGEHDRRTAEILADTAPEEDLLDVTGPASPVSSILDDPGNARSTSARRNYGQARSPVDVDVSDGDEDSSDDEGAHSRSPEAGERSQRRAPGTRKGKANVKRRRQDLPLSERKPPKEQRYSLWPVVVLQKVCQHRRIKGQQRNRDKDALSAILEKDDRAKGRASPYTGDFGGDLAPAGGENPGEEGDSDIPPGALIAMRTMMRNGLPAKKRSDAILFEGKKYGVGRLLDALKKSGGEGNDGPSDEDISQGAPTNSRKTKNCLPRLVNVMVLPEFRPRMVASEAQASRAELDVGAVGARRSVWVDLASAFRDPNTPVDFRISEDAQFMSLDPGTCYQPNITPGKLLDMYNSTRKKLGTVVTNFKKSGMGEPFWNFCSGDSDVFYLREAGVQYPELAELTQTLMPDDVAEEAGMTASSDGGGESSGDDDDDGDNIGGRNASRSEANRLKKKSRARQASKRRQKKAKESIAEYMPAVRRELQGAQTNLTSTTVAPAALDTERALNKYEADMSFQKVRMGRAEADKEVARRENRRNAREEYKRLRDELRKEEAEPERDEEFIAVLKGAAADALKSMKGE